MKSHVEMLCGFIAGTAMLLSLIAVHASADQSIKIPRIGVRFSPDASSPMEEGLRQGFRDRGYSENVNISGPDVKEASRRRASFVDRILKGAKAGNLPFEQGARFELVIDTRIAREQGIEVPHELLLRADEVLR